MISHQNISQSVSKSKRLTQPSSILHSSRIPPPCLVRSRRWTWKERVDISEFSIDWSSHVSVIWLLGRMNVGQPTDQFSSLISHTPGIERPARQFRLASWFIFPARIAPQDRTWVWMYISPVILLHEKFLQFDGLKLVVFQLNLKYLHACENYIPFVGSSINK